MLANLMKEELVNQIVDTMANVVGAVANAVGAMGNMVKVIDGPRSKPA